MVDNLSVANQRDSWFDNSKGILMIAVVVGHFIASVLGKFDTLAFLSNYIYFFHMPAFAIISGFFLKRRVDTKDYASVINKTLIPYCFAQVVIYLFAIILPSGVRALSAERFAASGLFSFLFPMYHLWFFVGLIIAFAFLNLCPRKKCIFTRLGEKSVYIYVLHVVFVAIVRHLHYEYGILFELDSLVNKIIYLVFCVVVCYLLTTPPVVKLFKKLFEPNFDIRKIPEYLTKK